MASGETVKYIIDADTSGFARGMAEAAVESQIAGKAIDKNLSRTAKRSENNFSDIRRSASTAASQIRNFGVAMQALNTTSLIIGITALTGAIIELSGAIAAAGSTSLILLPILAQSVAGVQSFKAGVSGLDAAFKALSKDDPKAFAEAMAKLGPAGQSVAKAAGGIRNAFKSIQLNTQQALLAGIGDRMLELGGHILPIVNIGMQQVGNSMNAVLQNAADLGQTPLFKGLLSTVFADTARNVAVLGEALGPVLNIFNSLYLITRPYVTLLAQQFVNLTKSAAAYLGSAKGQTSLNIAIQEGLIAIKELGSLVGAVFGLLTSLFRTSVNAGNSLIPTLTGIIRQMTAWVNSADGQAKLIALFRLTSLTLVTVSKTLGNALQFFFSVIQAIDSLSPGLQRVIVGFIGTALVIRPLISYLSQLYLAFRVLGVTLFNFVEQAFVVFAALGAGASIALVIAAAFIALAAVIRGPLGAAFLILGGAIATYIALNFLLSLASEASAAAFFQQGVAALTAAEEEIVLAEANVLLASTMYATAAAAVGAGASMSFAGRAAIFLQRALIPLLVIAGAVLVILNLLGVLGSKTKKTSESTTAFGDSLAGLKKSLKGVNNATTGVSGGGLSALNQSLGDTAAAADTASGSLAGFDKMNVLTDKGAAGAGIGGLPSVPDFGGGGGSIPAPNTDDFLNSLDGIDDAFKGLSKDFGKGLPNPFKTIADWLNAHPGLGMIVLGTIVTVIGGLFVAFGFAAIAAVIGVSLTVGLIVLAIAAVIAIVILLAKNWDTVTNAMVVAWQWVYDKFQVIGLAIYGFFLRLGQAIGGFFYDAWQVVVTAWQAAVAFFQGVWDGIKFVFGLVVSFFSSLFTNAWNAIKLAFSAVGTFFAGVWGAIVGAFSTTVSWFASLGANAWKAITGAFASVGTWFKENVVDKITGVFTGIGKTISDFFTGIWTGVGNTLKSAINTVLKLPLTLPKVHIWGVGDVGGQTLIPKLARGGIVTSPTFAQIGEAGAEAVMPLENNTGWIQTLADKINSSNGQHNGQALNLTVQIGEDQVANKIIDLINEKTQMSGRNTIMV